MQVFLLLVVVSLHVAGVFKTNFTNQTKYHVQCGTKRCTYESDLCVTIY